MKRLLVLVTLSGILSGAADAADRGGIEVKLTANRVVTVTGTEVFASAELARPGDIIEYRVVYANTGDSLARGVLATLPIPVNGLEFLPGNESPRAVLASLDGKTFAPVPLVRAVRLKDGTQEMRPVPLGEYRYLRWDLGDLAAGADKTVSARMRITRDTSPSTASR